MSFGVLFMEEENNFSRRDFLKTGLAASTFLMGMMLNGCAQEKEGSATQYNANIVYTTPEMYGAVGDGEMDDTAALQMCIQNSRLVLLTGSYRITNTITLHSDLTLCGFGIGKVIKDPTAAQHYSSLSYYGDLIENVIVDGLILAGVKHWTGVTLSGLANDIGIRVFNSKQVSVKNCSLYDFGGAAIALSGEQIEIQNNTIHYSGSFSGENPNYNFGISYSGTGITISKNSISGVSQGIISGIENRNVMISQNNISTKGQHGLYMEGAVNVTVVNNIIHDCALCGIKFQINNETEEFEGIIISDNRIDNCFSQGILIVDLLDLFIIDNVVITNNCITKTQRGIQISKADNIIINSNLIDEITQYGLYITNCNDITISNNRLYLKDADGIIFSDQKELVFNRNIMINNNSVFIESNLEKTRKGLHISNGSNVIVSMNCFRCVELVPRSLGIWVDNDSSSMTSVLIHNNMLSGFSVGFKANSLEGISVDGT